MRRIPNTHLSMQRIQILRLLLTNLLLSTLKIKKNPTEMQILSSLMTLINKFTTFPNKPKKSTISQPSGPNP